MMSHILLSVETTLLISVAALYIVHCPFNKVEESFNTQAVHDVVNIFPNNLPHTKGHVSPIKEDENSVEFQLTASQNHSELATRSQLLWDHTSFAGVVPRTFVGALLVGLPMKLAKHFMFNGFLSFSQQVESEEDEPDLTAQFVLQIGSRFALSSFVVLSLSAITRAIHKRYGLPFRLCFLVATVSQFHYMFYAGRFLPNTFATILTNLVFASWINRQYSKSVIYIAFCVVIFRFDTAIFFGWLLFDAVFIRKYLPLGRVLQIGIPAGLLALLITFSIDSIFWARPVWPELEGLYYNIWLNKSHEWGTAPFFWYIYNCLPRMLMAGSPFILLAEHRITRDYLIPTLAFIFTYSFLPHKELRFILFVTPFINMCVASGLMNVHYYLNKIFLYIHSKIVTGSQERSKTPKKPPKDSKKQTGTNVSSNNSYIANFLFILLLLAMLLANMFACFILSRVSSLNYPGGQAALSLGMTKEMLVKAQASMDKSTGSLKDHRSDVGVYVNNLAAQTGVSRFVQVNGAYYAKTPHLDENTFKKSYNLIYLILEPREVLSFVKSHCPLNTNQEHLFDQGTDKWKRSNSELKCNLPNQSQMYCSIIDSINSFKSINIGGLIRRMMEINSIESASNSLDNDEFIKTRIALHIIRCSTRSKFNPFS